MKAKTSELDKGIVSGVEMIRKQFLDLLKKNQVLEIDALGKRFDPAFHEALSKEERARASASRWWWRCTRKASSTTTSCCARR